VEDVAKITKLGNSPAVARGGSMVVNTEWGAFDNAVCNPSSSCRDMCSLRFSEERPAIHPL